MNNFFWVLFCLVTLLFNTGCKVKGDGQSSDPLWIWNSIAFDIEISIKALNVPSEKQQEIADKLSLRTREIEQLFSLYISDSKLSMLNCQGELQNAPPEFIKIVERSIDLGKQTNGLFDVSVQPLWEYKQKGNELELEQVLAKINYLNISIQKNSNTVIFKTKGMKLTFNGLVQGYLTDQLLLILKGEGVLNALVNAGEYRAIGNDQTGTSWTVEVQSPQHSQALTSVKLKSGQALAVSAGYGHVFDVSGKSHHLFHPKNASNQPANRTIIVTAESAIKADALATAFAVCPKDQWRKLAESIKVSPLFSIQIHQGEDVIWSY